MEYEERDYRLWLSSLMPYNPKGLRMLVKKFGSAESVYFSDKNKFKELSVSEKVWELVRNSQRNISKTKKSLYERGIWFKVLGESGMPEIFEHFDDLPFILFGIGSERVLNTQHALGVVGSRKMTEYGQVQVKRLLREVLRDNSVTVVSGMARGIDSLAHWEAINANAGTIAVLGNGVDVCYPAENRALYKKILDSKSVIISEYFPGTNPKVGFFPMRNRIIAAMSDALFVVEAGVKSGTLITANAALNYGKNLGVLPGRVDMPNSLGALKLIKDGAEPIIDHRDLRQLLGMSELDLPAANDFESEIILNSLSGGPKMFDEMVYLTELDRTVLLAKIGEMIMEGKILDSGTGFYTSAV